MISAGPWLTRFMFAMMGLGSWHLTNSLWAQLPAYINYPVPEGAQIATQMNFGITS